VSTPLETTVETRSRKEIIKRGAMPIKYGQEGLPDQMILWGRGVHFWVEFKKAKTGRLRAAQKVWRKYLTQIGDSIYVVDSFEQMTEILDTWEMAYGPATARRC
jgi:hypothetical protein